LLGIISRLPILLALFWSQFLHPESLTMKRD
jgi:hypothetical protein